VHASPPACYSTKTEVTAEEAPPAGKNNSNFGVIYGMGAHAFAPETGVSKLQAKEFSLEIQRALTPGFSVF